MDAVQKYNLTLNKEKSNKIIKPNSDRLKPLRDLQPPTDYSSLRRTVHVHSLFYIMIRILKENTRYIFLLSKTLWVHLAISTRNRKCLIDFNRGWSIICCGNRCYCCHSYTRRSCSILFKSFIRTWTKKLISSKGSLYGSRSDP